MVTIKFYDNLGYGAQQLGSGYIFFSTWISPRYSISVRSENYDVFYLSGIDGVNGATFNYSLGGSWVTTKDFTFTYAGEVVAEILDFTVNTPRSDVLSSSLFEMLLLSKDNSIHGNKYKDYLAGEYGNDRIFGNGGNDFINGGEGHDIINGGTGADTMLGGSGNDTYYVDNTGDRVYETTTTSSTTDAGGTDSVYSYLSSYTLGNFVENGRIMSTGAANLTGNGLNNVIYAGKGSNVMAGGSGTDTLSYAYGANGTTGVKVSLATTSAQATGGSGTDTISGFERLTGSANGDSLTGNGGANLIRGGNGNDTVIGGSGNDTLYGDAGNDLLRGGTGNDILYGGAGKDILRFDTALGTSTTPNIDTIKDFSVLDDTIQLENAIFKSFGTKTGVIGTGNFKANLTGRATDSNDYIIYETDTGKVFYDADGSGAAASVQIALVGTGLALSSADFVLV